MIRRAIVIVQQSAQTLRTPVILNVNPEPSAAETLSICVSGTGERTVTTVPVEHPGIIHTTDAVGSLSSDRFPVSDRLPSLLERIQRRTQRLQYEVQPQAPVHDSSAQALMGVISRQKNVL